MQKSKVSSGKKLLRPRMKISLGKSSGFKYLEDQFRSPNACSILGPRHAFWKERRGFDLLRKRLLTSVIFWSIKVRWGSFILPSLNFAQCSIILSGHLYFPSHSRSAVAQGTSEIQCRPRGCSKNKRVYKSS